MAKRVNLDLSGPFLSGRKRAIFTRVAQTFFSLVLTLWSFIAMSDAREVMTYRRAPMTAVFVPSPASPPVIAASAALVGEARMLCDALRQATGVSCEIALDRDVMTEWCGKITRAYWAKDLILLGRLDENMAVFPFYARYQTNADGVTPGVEGVLIQPLPNWAGPGSRALLIAGGGANGTATAVKELVGKIAGNKEKTIDLYAFSKFAFKGLALKNQEVSLKGAKNLLRKRKQADAWEHCWYPFAYAYWVTGDVAWAEAAAEALDTIPESPWETSDNHYGMAMPALAWKWLTRSGKMPPAVVAKVDRALFRYLVQWENAWWRRSEGATVFMDNRHHVYGTWGYLNVAESLYEGLDQDGRETSAGRFLRDKIHECQRWLAVCGTNWRPAVPSDGEFHDAAVFLLSAARTGDVSVFRDGHGREMAALAIASVDNLGHSAGTSEYEDTYPGAWRWRYPIGPIISIVALYERDPQLFWFKKHFAPFHMSSWWELGGDTRGFSVYDAPEKPATDYLGFQPLRGEKGAPLYLAFRAGFAPRDLYFLVTGASGLSATSPECDRGRQVYPNMIARLSWRGKPWLISNTNRATAYHRNALLIESDRGMATMAADNMETQTVGGDAHGWFAVCRTKNSGSKADWSRAFVISNQDWFLVEDRVMATEKGAYSAIATWRSPHAGIRGAGDSAAFVDNGVALALRPWCDAPLRVEVTRSTELDGATRPGVIRQRFAARLDKGAATTLTNLFSVDSAPAERYALRRLADRAYLIRDSRDGAICLAGFGPVDKEGLTIDAEAFLFSSATWKGLDIRSVKWHGRDIVVGPAPKDAPNILAALWESAPSTNPPDAADALPGVDPAWAYVGFNQVREELFGFQYGVKVKDEKVGANLPAVFDGMITGGGVTWAPGEKTNLELTFQETTKIGAVALCHAGTAKDPIRVSAMDGSNAAPVVTRQEAFTVTEEPYKGQFRVYGGTRVFGDGEGKRFLVEGFPGPLVNARVYGVKTRFPRVRSIALCRVGDGEDIAVALTDDNQLAAFRLRDGRPAWRVELPTTTLSMAVGDIDGDHRDEIAVGTLDQVIHRIDPATGKTLWKTSIANIVLGTPYSLAAFPGDRRENRGFIASSYYHMTLLDPHGKILNPKQKTLPGMWLYDVMGGDLDLNGDGVTDAISRALWGHVNLFNGKTGKVDYFANLPGRLVNWTVDFGDGADKPVLRTVIENGVGAYAASIRPEYETEGFDGAPDEDALLLEPRSKRTLWEVSGEDLLVGAVFLKNQTLTLGVGGTLTRYDLDGKILGRENVGPAGVSLSPFSDGKTAAALINDGERLTVIDADAKTLCQVKFANRGAWTLADGTVVITDSPTLGVCRVNMNADKEKGEQR